MWPLVIVMWPNLLTFDPQVIEMIKREILPSFTAAPQEFLHRLTTILNQGSIHSATDQFDGERAFWGLQRAVGI